MKNNIEKKFIVPENYFSQLEKEIFLKTVLAKKQVKRFYLTQNFYAAASVLLLVSGLVFFSVKFAINYNTKMAEKEKQEKEILKSFYNQTLVEQEIAQLDY